VGYRHDKGESTPRTIGTLDPAAPGANPLIPKKNPPGETKVESTRHKDKRKNIPTEELRDFIADDEAAPKTMLYRRDPSLDPQLVWKGKDEQDRQDLAVPIVPVYIQEKIHPQAIIDDLLAQRKKGKPEEQLTLFADFNGMGCETPTSCRASGTRLLRPEAVVSCRTTEPRMNRCEGP
jgi:hypothetical protein